MDQQIPTAVLLYWTEIHKQLWHSNGSISTDNAEGHPILNLYERHFDQTPILVREEYKAVRDFVFAARLKKARTRSEGLLLYGQPGIGSYSLAKGNITALTKCEGKTLCLYFLLGSALAAKIPVALCKASSYYLLFNEDGVHVRLFTNPEPNDSNVLVLFDCNTELPVPRAPWVNRSTDCYLIAASSPKARIWSSWVKERGAMIWPMDTWSPGELIILEYMFPH
jgi:hypothetical protein